MNRKNAYIVGIALLCSISAIADGDTKTKSKINERQTSAVSTVTSEELEKNSTPNPYNTLYGSTSRYTCRLREKENRIYAARKNVILQRQHCRG